MNDIDRRAYAELINSLDEEIKILIDDNERYFDFYCTAIDAFRDIYEGDDQQILNILKSKAKLGCLFLDKLKTFLDET